MTTDRSGERKDPPVVDLWRVQCDGFIPNNSAQEPVTAHGRSRWTIEIIESEREMMAAGREEQEHLAGKSRQHESSEGPDGLTK